MGDSKMLEKFIPPLGDIICLPRMVPGESDDSVLMKILSQVNSGNRNSDEMNKNY